MLYEFLINNNMDLVQRCRYKVSNRQNSSASPGQLENGIPLFLDQLIRTLKLEQSEHPSDTFVSPPGHGDARQLNEVAIAHGCDLLIAGAYGHSQMREWLVGGVTHSLLQPQRYSTFLSH